MSVMKVKFVSSKISKIRWKPKSSSVFITGTYDDDENVLTIWKFPTATVKETDDKDVFEENDPLPVFSETITGSVTDLSVISDQLFMVATSVGSLAAYKYSDEKFQCVYEWEAVHNFGKYNASLTALTVKGHEGATVGEDGRLCTFNFHQMQKIRDIDCPDQCSFTTVSFLRHQEVVVGNSLGYIRVWDLRSPSDTCCQLIRSRNMSRLTSMNTHPTQNHVLASGDDNGCMHLWDMREDRQPVSALEGHSAAISELIFHPSNPDFIFTCSLDGSVLQWDASSLRSSYSLNQHEISTPSDPANQSIASRNVWLTSETSKHRLEITSLFSQPASNVNSFDFSNSMLLWTTDNEAIYMCNDVVL